jgi:hypothetical protein
VMTLDRLLELLADGSFASGHAIDRKIPRSCRRGRPRR